MDKTMENSRLSAQKLELASRNVDRALACDFAAPNLVQLTNINAQGVPSASGLTEHDYPILNTAQYNLHNMTQIKLASHVPLPAEVLEHFTHVQCHCMMGLFPEINRAWLTVDSDIYVWKYEENSDLAYFDGLNETILAVGLVKPKAGVFHNFIKYLLVLTTAVDVVVLGVTFAANTKGNMEVIQLIPDPVFSIPTDGASISVITGTHNGRLFLGSKEGSLYEIVYQAESGWFGKRCKKINHSTSSLSFLVPSFLNAALTEEDGITQISVDNTRNILYILTEKGSIEIWDLGEKGDSTSRVAKVTQTNLVHQAMNTVKTLDSQNFRPIVSISAVEAPESAYIHLVAVTQTGVRFYLSAISLASPAQHQRPSTLVLQHVRLPPGYSANISIRPRGVYMANYSDRNLLLLSKVNEKDVLWCVSSDLFPFCHSLMEAYTTLNLDAPVVAVAEIRHDESYLCEPGQEAPPLVVRQHAEPPKKYIVLTSHGVHVFLKLRPVDILKQLLSDSQGQDSEAVKSFFTIQKEEQACATSLILASLENEENFDTADYACRAFFVFGGEPKVTPPLNQTNFFSGSVFSPNIISTPAPPHYQQQQNYYPSALNESQNLSQQITSDTPFVYSPKHNGLYLYVGRILRPLWNRRCVQKVCLDPKTIVSTSTISARNCISILSNLSALHNFLQSNTQLSICHLSANQTNQTFTQQSMFNNTSMNVTRNPMNYTIQDAQLEERQSLDSLKAFVSHCCQVLGLWKILCEHQIHDLIAKLPEIQQIRLQDTTFKNLFLHETDTCTNLIHALIDSYLGDNASVDSISGILRDVCPSLYRHEDATFSKANEKLITSRSIQNIDEKEELVSSALEMCKSIAPNINLTEICKQFVALKAYRAVTELCAVCAKKTDPENYAEEFYKSANKAADQQGYALYQKRMDIYNEVVRMLDAVHNDELLHSNTSINNVSMYSSDYSMLPGKITEATQTNVAVQVVINDILEYPDELLHVALYEWMMSKQMSSSLIKVEKQSLEMFLIHAAQGNEHNTDLMDLLWKYYESNGNHASAAKILNNMASKTGHTINLKKRLEYLSRAIMSMRSDKVGYAPHLGVFLRDLEDKLDIAKVQEQILEAIVGLRGSHPNAEEAIMALNSGLYQMSQLYENFAEPLQLWECQLAIIDCAGYSDRNLVEKIWRNIFKKELVQSKDKQPNDALGVLLSKVKILARKYLKSVHCFPLDFIVRELELISAGLRADKSLIPVTLVSINVPILDLLEIYNRIILTSTSDRFWQKEENEFHLAESVACLVNTFLETHDSINSAEKRKIIAQCQDIVASILSNLYSKANTENLVDNLRSLQSRLSRL